MRVLVPTHDSRAIVRIGDALERSAPCEVGRIAPIRKDTKASRHVPGEEDADLVVLFVNGMRDHQEALAARCRARGQRYAVVQIALRTTRHPRTTQWRKLWAEAAVVWSYYPIPLWIKEDAGAEMDFNFYHAPLGVDASVFTLGADALERSAPRPYTVCTSGFRRNQEGVAECDEAVYALGGRLFQLGSTYAMRSDTTFATELSDTALAEMFRQCQFVSGLRREEGFELPAAEGLLCGARPLLFDRPHYRCWYEPWGEFVREDSLDIVKRDLIQLFDRGPKVVTPEEREAAAKRFNWETICRGFWERCIA